jgi:hypothetical protein
MAYSRTAEKLNTAKKALIEAYKAAMEENLPQSLMKSIDSLTGRTEALENRIMYRNVYR